MLLSIEHLQLKNAPGRKPEMGPPGTGTDLERIWNGNGNGQKSVPVLTVGPRARLGTDRRTAQQRPQNGTAPFQGTNQSWQIRSSRSNPFLYRYFPVLIPFIADKPIKSLTWTNSNTGIGFGGALMESTNKGAAPGPANSRANFANTAAWPTASNGGRRQARGWQEAEEGKGHCIPWRGTAPGRGWDIKVNREGTQAAARP